MEFLSYFLFMPEAKIQNLYIACLLFIKTEIGQVYNLFQIFEKIKEI